MQFQIEGEKYKIWLQRGGIFLAGMALSYVLIGLKSSDSSPVEKETNKKEKAALPVVVAPLDSRDMYDSFQTYSNLLPAHSVKIKFKQGTTIQEVFVKTGDEVKLDQEIANVSSPIETLKLQLADIEMRSKQAEFATTNRLASQDFVAKNVLSKKKRDLEMQVLRQQINKLQSQAGKIRAPLAGIVANISISEGDYVDDGNKSFVEIMSYESYKINLHLPQSVATKIDLDTDVKIEVHGDDEQVQARIKSISPVVDKKSGTIATSLVIDDPPLSWKPGMHAKINIIAEEKIAAPVVPNDAIVGTGDDRYIFGIIKGKKGTKAQKIKPGFGINDGHFTEILDELAIESDIVVRGQGMLKDKAKIKVQETLAH